MTAPYPYIYQILEHISWAGVIAMTVYFVIRPLIIVLVNKMNGVSTDVAGRVDEISNNCLSDVNRRLEMLEGNDIRLDNSIDKIRDDMADIRERIAKIETKLK